ncbi:MULTISPECIES: trans-acting enoyl reductase family protein [Anaeromyxobacter]|uniref:saccharopine dehydrogenase family protein n=1 Tax=Anaeromyxobacter TaxID=161492 RepID=UPI001F577B18|nr:MULTISPECIES: saccharopine dehydrogenase NADP-binding domain-containing protein [unclassified Anaeromyxobacter]
MAGRPYDVTLFGATGFTGRLAARYLSEHAPPGLRWAVAGRSGARLELVKAEAHASGLVVADSADPGSIDAMAAGTRVLATTVGPFAHHGGPVVDACVRHRVDYVDITGETAWVRGLVDRHHEAAALAGTRIVPFCGFDSVPSDLGALLVASFIRDRWGQDTRRVSASFALRGGYGGGTLATVLHSAETGELVVGRDVLLLNPAEHRTGAERARSADLFAVRRDPVRQVWLAPFPMARVNTRVVRRSNALLEAVGRGYGPEFAYEEAAEYRSRLGAEAARLGLRLFERALAAERVRALLRRFGPAPGEGPSPAARELGAMRLRLVGEAASGRKVLATLRARGDPGSRVTVMTLCEAALALATQREALPRAPAGGVLTPATAVGLLLLDRLEAAGLQVEVGPVVRT